MLTHLPSGTVFICVHVWCVRVDSALCSSPRCGSSCIQPTAKILNSSPLLAPLILPFIAQRPPSGPTLALTPGHIDLPSIFLS